MGKTSRIVIVESYPLSDGKAQVSRIGRLWFFTRFHVELDQAPDTSGIISKDEAYGRLEEALKADVLETE